MWKRFAEYLWCPCCQNKLDIVSIEEYKVKLETKDYTTGEHLGIQPDRLNEYIETGTLLCRDCKHWYPILYGLPVILPYETPIVHEFLQKHGKALPKDYVSPKEMPRLGEKFVLKSFSKEWLEYNYDGVIWGWSYEDREKTFLTEMGFKSGEIKGVRFLEIGCGLGVTTSFAQKNYKSDAVGVDLSLAVLKATDYYRKNPFLHFLQTTLFQLPFKEYFFDMLYSHGVLHHTYSTKEAFKAISRYCKPNGWTYIWVYGKGGQTNSWDRKMGHYAEVFLRPMLSRLPSKVATIFLSPIALGYMLLNSILRRHNPTLQPYNFKRALHAARDRFTPLYAHRQSYEEVEGWFAEFGFKNIQRVDWHTVPPAVHALFRGAVGVRGQRN
jgi:SAM-dependent methyltransferase/uncharacterized protein YbaR (Trm112 family)